MRIRDLLKNGGRTISFEFYPPKNEVGEQQLAQTLEVLKTLHPSYISVTYGAMGTTRARTFEIAQMIKFEKQVESMAHLTCVGHTRADMTEILQEIKDRGLENVLGLRGDPPAGTDKFVKPKDGLGYASELIALIRKEHGDYFSIGAAGYPEGHQECADKKKDLAYLKAKVDAGAEFIITQLFFDNQDFFQFRDTIRSMGVTVPVIAGIMPIANAKQIERFTKMCGAKIPAHVQTKLDGIGDDHEAVEAYGIEYASEQCRQLWDNGVDGIHFYTLNKSKASKQIYENLNLEGSYQK